MHTERRIYMHIYRWAACPRWGLHSPQKHWLCHLEVFIDTATELVTQVTSVAQRGFYQLICKLSSYLHGDTLAPIPHVLITSRLDCCIIHGAAFKKGPETARGPEHGCEIKWVDLVAPVLRQLCSLPITTSVSFQLIILKCWLYLI